MAEVIPLATGKGHDLLRSAPPEAVNWRAMECAVPQVNACYCGPAALAAALSMSNAARKSTVFSQETLFEHEMVRRFLTPAQMLGRARREWTDGERRIPITFAGMSIEEAARVLGVYLDDVSVQYAEDQGLEAFIEWLGKVPTTPAVINFLGAHLKLPLGGHFALLGAFERESQRVLVLDPARHKLGWYWAHANDLFEAMRKPRAELKRSRGWLSLDGGE